MRHCHGEPVEARFCGDHRRPEAPNRRRILRAFAFKAVPTIVPVTRKNYASRAYGSQLARSSKRKIMKDLRGKSRLVERRVSVYQTALRSSLEILDLAHPAGQWVPSGTNLGHQPSLTLANESVSYGWQATRRWTARRTCELRVASPASSRPDHAKVGHRSAKREGGPACAAESAPITSSNALEYCNAGGPEHVFLSILERPFGCTPLRRVRPQVLRLRAAEPERSDAVLHRRHQ
jgi:hypothetical protein